MGTRTAMRRARTKEVQEVKESNMSAREARRARVKAAVAKAKVPAEEPKKPIVANVKAAQLIEFAKGHGWKGQFEEDGEWLHVTARREHPEFGNEQVELWWQGNSMNRPPEYSRNGSMVIEKNSAEIRRRLAGEPTIATKNAFDGTTRREPVARRTADEPKRREIRQQKLPFSPESEDDKILRYVCGKRVYCSSMLYEDFPPTEHDVPSLDATRVIVVDGQKHRVPLPHQPRVVRLEDGQVNVDYVTSFGFRSLCVNSILRIR